MIDFYRRFLPRIAPLAPLEALIKGQGNEKKRITWEVTSVEAFNATKRILINTTMPAYPSPDGMIVVFVDTSNVTAGASLQQQMNGRWWPLAFFSKEFNHAQTRNSTYDRELLAI